MGTNGQVPESPVRSRTLLGTDVAVVDYEGAMDRMQAMIERRERGYVCALAVHGLMLARRDPELAAALAGATLVVPDGMPLVWAVNRLGEGLEDRVYGPELMLRFCARSAATDHRVYLYGGFDPSVLEIVWHRLETRFPGIRIVGALAPGAIEPGSHAEEEVAEAINEARPDVVWCGLGCPRQELWMARMRWRVEAPVLVGVGAAFDFIAGRVPQAPPWMQRRGLEWAYRVAQEPRRLLPRYLRHNPGFVAAFAGQYVRERRQTPGR